jgi:hypothetical protein
MELKITKLAKIIPFNEFSEHLQELKKRKEDLWKHYLNQKLKLENTNKCIYYNDLVYRNLRNDLTKEEKLEQEKETIKIVEKYNKPVEMNYESVYLCTTINVDNLVKKDFNHFAHRSEKCISPRKNYIAKLANNYKENTLKSNVFELTKTPYRKGNKRDSKSNLKVSRSKLLEYKLNWSNKQLINDNKTTATTNIMFTEPSRGASSIHTYHPSNNFIEYAKKSASLKKNKAEQNIDKRVKMTIDNWNSTKNSRFYDSGNYEMPLLCFTTMK